ncbi:MAG: DJ-1 family glyoxalase III [Coraliomargarita sp.]
MKRALIILHPGFEEIEAITPIDLLSRAEVEVVQAYVGDQSRVEGRSGICVEAQQALEAVLDQDFDLVILPGGPGINSIRQHPHICELLQRQHSAQRLIGCICAAPLLLLDSGLTEGLSYTCHPAAAEELSKSSSEACVIDDHIITSRGAGTATQFALSLIGELCDQETANAIAESICWSPSAD